jgi:ribosomal protein S18 acetylase RimI-like enzyme
MELGRSKTFPYVAHDVRRFRPVPDERAGCPIRRATSEDADGILACLRVAFADYRETYTPAAFADTVLTLDTMRERLAKMLVFVAVDRSTQVVGTIACGVINRDEGHLRGMAVLPELRGSGIAVRLLQRAESELRQRKCTHVTLDTTEPLQRAMGFYEKNGFRRSGKITDFFGMPLFEYDKTLAPPDAALIE